MKRDNKQGGFCFGDFELFAAESAQVASSAPMNVEPAPVLLTEPCRPEGCEHSDEEHRAFDAGVKAGESGDDDECPYYESWLRVTWSSGHSVGEMNRDYNEDIEHCENSTCGAQLEEGRIGYCDECLDAGYDDEMDTEQPLPESIGDDGTIAIY